MTWIFVNGGEERLRTNAGQQWDEGAHKFVLVKHAHVPSSANTAYSNLTNFCNSAGYQHQNVAGKNFVGGNPVCSNPDFTNSGANPMTARYLYLIEGSASSPQAADRILMYADLSNGSAADSVITNTILLDAIGLIDYQRV